MKIFVKAHPKSRKKRVTQKDSAHFEVWVSEAPDKGKANEAVLKSLSDYLNIPRSQLKMCQGQHSRDKVVELVL